MDETISRAESIFDDYENQIFYLKAEAKELSRQVKELTAENQNLKLELSKIVNGYMT